MRNIESLVKPEMAPMLDMEIPQEALGEAKQEHVDAINEIAPDGKITMRKMIEMLYWIPEIGIPSRMAEGDELDEELVESTLETIATLTEALNSEALEELKVLYEGLAELSPGAMLHAKFRRSGMIDLGVLTTEQTQLIANGTGYVDGYTKLFEQRDDGWYYQDQLITHGVYVAREAMPKDRVVVMVFRKGIPMGAMFQRYSDSKDSWAKCAFHRDMEEHFENYTTIEIVNTLAGVSDTYKGK